MAVTYRALRGIALPNDIDQMELWQIGVLLGEDIGPPPLIVPRSTEPPPAPLPRRQGERTRLEHVE
jgi:hypothetical protein